MAETKLDLLQGTLDLMVLQTLTALGEMHGYGIARRIEQVSGDAVLLNQGAIYASLVRLQQRGWISAVWGTSDNNRKAKFYTITARGRKQLAQDIAYWERLSSMMGRVLAMREGVCSATTRDLEPDDGIFWEGIYGSRAGCGGCLAH